MPLIAPQGSLQRATAVASGAGQVATITGPALGGFAYAIAPHLAYAIMLLFWILGMILTGFIQPRPQAVAKDDSTDNIFAGVRFIRSNPAILGTISLDLFAVLFGGVTALLPIYARDILQTGPMGLGVLRAAPAVGALLMTMVLARHAITRHVGLRMFQAVIVFGVATIVFALSSWMWLSVLSLAVLGAADTISVVIRFSLVQLATPDEMRGRVGAVNFLFINASNQLGQFESGRDGRAVRRHAGRGARRRLHRRGGAALDEAVSQPASGGEFGVGPPLSPRHCEEPLRRSNPESRREDGLDCFAALAMTIVEAGWELPRFTPR